MVAKWRPFQNTESESGQSILEFLLMLPLMLGLTVLTIRMNMAIQISIVDQQYARAQAFLLTFNSPYYPEKPSQESGINQLVLGVSDNMKEGDDNQYTPEASVAIIARTRRLATRPGGDQEQPKERSHVRVRNTVTLCSMSHKVLTDHGLVFANNDSLVEGLTPKSFAYCRGAFDE